MDEIELKDFVEAGMSVGALIEALKKHDEKLIVVFSYSSSDYWGREISDTVNRVYEGDVKWSEYHRSLAPEIYESETEDIEDCCTQPTEKVVILGG